MSLVASVLHDQVFYILASIGLTLAQQSGSRGDTGLENHEQRVVLRIILSPPFVGARKISVPVGYSGMTRKIRLFPSSRNTPLHQENAK